MGPVESPGERGGGGTWRELLGPHASGSGSMGGPLLPRGASKHPEHSTGPAL